MSTVLQRGGALLAVVAACLLGLSGCTSDGHFSVLGYSSRPNYDPGLRTIYVPIAQNVSYRQGLEFELTRAVIREIEQKSPMKVVSCRERADTALEMKVLNRPKMVILPNQLNEVRDAEVQILVEVVWRDLRPGHCGDILTNPKRYDPNELPLPGDLPAQAPKAVPLLLTPSASYQPELGGNTVTAEKQAIDRAAVQIRSMMELSW